MPRTISKVFRPMTTASTEAMKASKPVSAGGRLLSAGFSQSRAPSGRAMNPSRLTAQKTEQRTPEYTHPRGSLIESAEMHDVIVVGAGHAGIEAALACARMGHETLVLTLKIEATGR